MDTPTQDQHFSPTSQGAAWTEADPQSNLRKLETAFAERSDGNAVAVRDVYHIAQRRHGYRGSFQEAVKALGESGKFIVDHGDVDRPSMVKRV